MSLPRLIFEIHIQLQKGTSTPVESYKSFRSKKQIPLYERLKCIVKIGPMHCLFTWIPDHMHKFNKLPQVFIRWEQYLQISFLVLTHPLHLLLKQHRKYCRQKFYWHVLKPKALHKMAKALLSSEVSSVGWLVVVSVNMRSNRLLHATASTASLVNILRDAYRDWVLFANEA